MRGMGRRGGSSYGGSNDKQRHMGSLAGQGNRAIHDEREDSVPATSPPALVQVTSAPASLARPSSSSILGSSSSSVSTPCASGDVTPNDRSIVAPIDRLLDIRLLSRAPIQIANGMLHPSDVCARKITFIFKERLDDNGYCWKNVSKETKDFYWNEFQKHFVWDESLSYVIKMAWQRKAAERYRALMCSLRKEKEKSVHVSDAAWERWKEAWDSAEFKAKSEKCAANRLSETGGVGCGISRHTGGSISHASHADRLRSKLGREPQPFELFELTHTKKGTSDLVDARAQAVKDRYLELVDQASQTQEGGGEPPVVDEKAIYYEAVGGEKKRRVYGVGSQGSIFYPKSAQSSSTDTSSIVVRNEIQELRQTVVRLENNNNDLQQSLREIKEERDQLKVEMMNQVKDMMMHFKTELLQYSQFTTQDSQPFTDDDHHANLDDM